MAFVLPVFLFSVLGTVCFNVLRLIGSLAPTPKRDLQLSKEDLKSRVESSTFVRFEQIVVAKLLSHHMHSDDIEALIANAEVDVEHTGIGYFLTVSHPAIPHQRVVCSKPRLHATCEGVLCGFVVFLEGGKLNLECFSYADSIRSNIRGRDLQVEEAKN
jgi:hypothetical protein